MISGHLVLVEMRYKKVDGFSFGSLTNYIFLWKLVVQGHEERYCMHRKLNSKAMLMMIFASVSLYSNYYFLISYRISVCE